VRRIRGGSIRSRLTRTLVGLGLVSVILLAAVNFIVVRGLLDRGTRDQLESLRDLRADAVELGMAQLLTRTSVFGADPGVADALVELEATYVSITDELTDDQVDELTDAYAPVVGRYDDAGVDRPPVDELLPTSTPGQYVQYHYIAANPETDRAAMVDAGDGSAYSEAHARHHEYLANLARTTNASDLVLVGIDTAEVVYSMSKKVDIGTNVLEGPYVDSGLGRAFAKLGGAAIDTAVIADTSFYLPDSSAPVVHVAAAVRSDAEVVGALVLVLRTERLTDIVTASQQWELLGLGETGDAYIVGSDTTMRTVPRAWFDDAVGYLDRFVEVTGDERAAELIDFTGSPVLIQQVDNEAVRTALDGQSFVGGVDNYLGQSTLTATSPLAVADLGWVLVTEQQTSESRDELERFVVTIAVLLLILLSALTVVGLVLARVLARPVRPLVQSAARIADGDYRTAVPDLGRNELGDVGRQLEGVAARLREQEASIDAEERRITSMLSSVLPATLIDRVRSGERDLAEVVDTATVVAITLTGIPTPSGGELDTVVDLTTRLAQETSRLADAYGVERGQVALEHQLFVAGRGEAGTDAEAAAAFAAEVVRTVPSIGAEFGLELTARAGLSAGLVGTGVVGTRQVSFTVWGVSVSAAISLSTRAEPGRLLVDDTVADELGDEWSARADPNVAGTYLLDPVAADTTPE
jgi:class 3 adenylate cyclase